jgi:hypothetical protein
MQTCSTCNVEKPLDSFVTRIVAGEKRYRKTCKQCKNIKARDKYQNDPTVKANTLARATQYRELNPEKQLLAVRRSTWKNAGIDPDLAEAYYLAHDGNCEICGRKPMKLCIDHCHTSGKIRGMLCTQCNSLLGMAKDSTTTLSNAIAYLNR